MARTAPRVYASIAEIATRFRDEQSRDAWANMHSCVDLRGASAVERHQAVLARGKLFALLEHITCATHMSQKTVQLIVGQLLTDEEFRAQFLSDPHRVLTALLEQGFALTASEVEALVRTDRGMWPEAASRIDPDLQKCRLC